MVFIKTLKDKTMDVHSWPTELIFSNDSKDKIGNILFLIILDSFDI